MLKNPWSKPSAREGHAMAYDSARGVVVLFGGYYHTLYDFYLNDTWEWNGTNWTKKSPVKNPSTRSEHAMAYDSTRGVVVLFGGQNDWSPYQETWEWDGTNWTKKLPVNNPSARYQHSMAYDSARGVVALFGGYGHSSLNETWEWNGTNWVLKSPVNKPYSGSECAMAYDSTRRVVVLFGWDETWEY